MFRFMVKGLKEGGRGRSDRRVGRTWEPSGALVSAIVCICFQMSASSGVQEKKESATEKMEAGRQKKEQPTAELVASRNACEGV